MSVSLFHIPVTSCVVQLLKGYLVFLIFFFFFGEEVGLISFVPQGLSGMGRLQTENMNTQHTCGHNHSNSMSMMKKIKQM